MERPRVLQMVVSVRQSGPRKVGAIGLAGGRAVRDGTSRPEAGLVRPELLRGSHLERLSHGRDHFDVVPDLPCPSSCASLGNARPHGVRGGASDTAPVAQRCTLSGSHQIVSPRDDFSRPRSLGCGCAALRRIAELYSASPFGAAPRQAPGSTPHGVGRIKWAATAWRNRSVAAF